jgi:hypothetical protein
MPRKRYEREEIRESLEFLSYLGVDQVYSVLLYSYENDSANFRKDLNRFVAFQFLYKYIPGSPSVPEKKYFSDLCSGKISKKNAILGLLSLCKDQEKAFKKNLMQKSKYIQGKSGDLQFILEKYLYFKGGPDKFRKPTIEHIIPQNFSTDVLKKMGGDKKETKKIINQLGNLTILEERQNSSQSDFGDKPFKEKKIFFKKDLFIGNKKLLSYDFEDEPEKAILKRGEVVAGDLYKIFMYALETGRWKKE